MAIDRVTKAQAMRAMLEQNPGRYKLAYEGEHDLVLYARDNHGVWAPVAHTGPWHPPGTLDKAEPTVVQ